MATVEVYRRLTLEQANAGEAVGWRLVSDWWMTSAGWVAWFRRETS